MKGLPITRVDALAPAPREPHWLVEGLWADQAVGIVGGEPKCGKTFLALDLALAVASGAPALRHFPVPKPGPVLLFCAEDPPDTVRRRLDGIAAAAGVALTGLELHLITAAYLRLDSPTHRQALRESVEALRPRLLVLDPFVRLHRIDENAAQQVAPLLAYLRHLQRLFHTAVLLVHHARKGGASLRAGQALRGSSELHAWGDSNLYLRRRHERIVLHVEHRAAAAPADVPLELRQAEHALALALAPPDSLVDEPASRSASTPSDPAARVLHALAQASRPLSRAQLRDAARLRTHTLGELLRELVAAGRIHHTDAGYCIPAR
jgi:hypothetical protein